MLVNTQDAPSAPALPPPQPLRMRWIGAFGGLLRTLAHAWDVVTLLVLLISRLLQVRTVVLVAFVLPAEDIISIAVSQSPAARFGAPAPRAKLILMLAELLFALLNCFHGLTSGRMNNARVVCGFLMDVNLLEISQGSVAFLCVCTCGCMWVDAWSHQEKNLKREART